MLKPADPVPSGGRDRDVREIAGTIGRLVDDGKAYALSEVNLAKAVVGAKTKGAAIAASLLVAALFIALAAIVALCIGIVLALSDLLGPLLAGAVAFLLIGAMAALVGWAGFAKFKALL
jgi:putative superfamily III holin-X